MTMQMTEMKPQRTDGNAPAESELTRQVETVSRDVKELGRTAARLAKHKLNHTRERGEQLYGEARAKTRQTVARRPWMAMTAAVGLGLLGGLLLSRR